VFNTCAIKYLPDERKLLEMDSGICVENVPITYSFVISAPDGLSPRDPTWIGAWWLGFLIIFFILIGPAVALVFYPNPESKAADDESESDERIDPETALQDKNNRAPKKKRKRELALVDRHVRKTSDGQTLVPVGVREKIMGTTSYVLQVTQSEYYRFQKVHCRSDQITNLHRRIDRKNLRRAGVQGFHGISSQVPRESLRYSAVPSANVHGSVWCCRICHR
jgi:hypothetical protein